MKLLNKKTLSVAVAGIMALSSLTVGSMSALAADDQYAPVGEGSTAVVATKVAFTPSETAYYNISLATTKDNKTASAYYRYSDNQKKLSYGYDEDEDGEYTVYNTASSNSFDLASAQTEVDPETGLIKTGTKDETVYTPAQTTTKLKAGTTYYFNLNSDSIGEKTASTFTIAKNDFSYNFTEVESNVEYVSYYKYNEATNKYDAPVKKTVKTTTGVAATVEAYYGTSKAIAVPASFLGSYAVKEVRLNVYNEIVRRTATSVAIPEGVEVIGGMDSMYALSSVNLPSTLKTIESKTFEGDHAITGRVVIPASVESVGARAFYDTGINSVQVLSNDTSIGSFAFGYKEVLNDATPDPTDTTSAAVDGFFVVAPAASQATVYAAQNGFTAYDPANCAAGNHPYAVTKVAATVFAKGSTTSVCPVCGNTVKTSIKKKTFKISSLKSTKKKTIVVKAAKQKEMAGYQVQYSTSSKFAKKSTKTAKVATKKALNKTVKGLKSGKKYYVRVRAYKVVNGKNVYSSWTAKKSVKVK